MVGTAPGGELGGTWASPTVDATHSGSSHAAVQAAAEATAAAALSAHLTNTSDAHDASAISSVAAGNLAATDVQAALNELDTEKAATSHAHAGEDITSGTVADARIASTIARDSEVTAAVSAHEADTTSVHGIADTSALALTADVVTKALYDANTILKADSDNTPAALTMGASTILARLAAGNIVAATPAELRTLLALVVGTNVQAWDLDLDNLSGSKLDSFLPMSMVTSALAENFPRTFGVSNVGLLSTGRLSCAGIPVLKGTPCTSVSWLSATTAANTPTNWWFALCDSNFNVIRQSTDQLSAAWAANTHKTLAVDSIPVTAGARVASATVTLTIPTLSQALTDLVAPGDSIVVSNANIAAYNGTFTVVTVGATTITYVSGGSASDSLSAPFPTVQLAAAKRVYTMPADGVLFSVIMVKATTPPSLSTMTTLSGTSATTPLTCASGDSSLTGTCPSPIAHGTGSGGVVPYTAIS